MALPGLPYYIHLYGTKNASSAIVDYIWIYDDVKVQPFITPKDICSAKTYKGHSFDSFVKTETKEFHSTIKIDTKKYLFIKNITMPCLRNSSFLKCNTQKYSWNDAMQVCHQVGANLPQFLSTKEQNELLHILKVIKLFYYVEAVFIGYNAAGRNRYEFIFLFVDWQLIFF